VVPRAFNLFPGLVTNYAYDNLNRIATITYPTRTVTQAYDPLKNLKRATNENSSIYTAIAQLRLGNLQVRAKDDSLVW
jgi:hypothetical protein